MKAKCVTVIVPIMKLIGSVFPEAKYVFELMFVSKAWMLPPF